jgi:hypothetical protein
MNQDQIGNSLRRFYRMYGVANEGPPDNFNVSALLPSEDFQDEINLIDKICSDLLVIKKHEECAELIENVANSLGESNFMEEIADSAIEFDKSDKEHLTNGIFWHYLASVLHPKLGKELDVKISIPGQLPEINQELLKVQGSLIFRMYVALVYMKEGPTLNILNQAARNRKPISQMAKKLLHCDYVRHLRNALSHSTFKSTTFGIYFNDYDKFETVASPEFLNSLTTWVMLINLQCSTVIDHKNEK